MYATVDHPSLLFCYKFILSSTLRCPLNLKHPDIPKGCPENISSNCLVAFYKKTCYNLSFVDILVSSQFVLWVFEFCHILRFQVFLQGEQGTAELCTNTDANHTCFFVVFLVKKSFFFKFCKKKFLIDDK